MYGDEGGVWAGCSHFLRPVRATAKDGSRANDTRLQINATDRKPQSTVIEQYSYCVDTAPAVGSTASGCPPSLNRSSNGNSGFCYVGGAGF